MNDERQDAFTPSAFCVARHGSLVTRHCLWLAALAALLAASPSLADDLKLKDGQKISGTIVGFENGMFRVETEYGFVLVRKDKVISIEIKASEAKEGKSKPEERQTAIETPGETGNKTGEAARAGRPEGLLPTRGTSAASTSNVAPAVPPPVAATPPKPVSRPLNEPLPAHIDEHVEGNTYVNDTFHFAMYKPPDWKIYEELHREKVSAIVALASEDEQTVLFVDRQVWSGAPDLKNDSMDAKLRQTYEDYQVVSESETQVDGRPAVRRRFDGVMEGAEWHGVAVRVAEGSTVYGIIGLTSAETFQFQESVFNKIVRSFHFLTPTPESASPQRTGGL